MTRPSTASELREGAEAIADHAPLVEVPTGLARLREPFEPGKVGKLPKPFRKDAQKGTCQECGKWHGLPAMHLDFVGHGHVTERLLDVDPHWTWEPFALDATGLPALDRHGNLWIRLTICGVTRIGVGDGATMKILIGDAIRNAAMRFGVALDLWARGSEDEKDEDGETMPEPQEPPEVALLTELADLGDVGDKIRASLVTRSGEEDARTALLDPGWRKWLREAIDYHHASAPTPDTEGAE